MMIFEIYSARRYMRWKTVDKLIENLKKVKSLRVKNLYMAFIGSATSIWTSQKMVDYYVERKHMMEAESPESEDYERVAERLTYYRKNRNQYIWGIALIYLYSIGDAAVDALLSDFDNPVHLALLPNLTGGAQALMMLDF